MRNRCIWTAVMFWDPFFNHRPLVNWGDTSGSMFVILFFGRLQDTEESQEHPTCIYMRGV